MQDPQLRADHPTVLSQIDQCFVGIVADRQRQADSGANGCINPILRPKLHIILAFEGRRSVQVDRKPDTGVGQAAFSQAGIDSVHQSLPATRGIRQQGIDAGGCAEQVE
jgi:hypothetical protein